MKTLEPLIEKYITLLNGETENPERYKWEAIVHFQENWEIDAEDFSEMFDRAFAKRKNLMYYNSFGFLQKLALHFPDDCREMFRNLYDERRDLPARFEQWRQRATELLPLLKEMTKKKLNHQQDERTIAFLLVLRYPADYWLYKENVYRDLCDYLNRPPINEAGQKYFNFAELGSSVLSSIREHAMLQQAVKTFIPAECEFDSSKLILQDIIYRMLSSKELVGDYLESVRLQLMEQFAEDSHPFARHYWPKPHDKGTYRWISVWMTPKIDPYFLHYEFRIDNGYVRCELHAEGSTTFKTFMEPFLVSHCHISHKLASWAYGDEEKKKGFSKIAGNVRIPYQPTDEPTPQELEEIKRGLIDLYDTYQKPIETYLRQLPKNVVPHFKIPMKTPLNQILYGPPGTGKTFHTITHALSIIEEAPLESIIKEEREDLMKRFNNYRDDNLIEFVTFHQSMGYEDFIEGIKPRLETMPSDDSVSRELEYEMKSGIFKEISANASSAQDYNDENASSFVIDAKLLENKSFYKVSLGNTLGDSGDSVYNYCKENNCIAIGWGGDDVDYTGVQSRKEIAKRFEENGYDSKQVFNINAIERLALWMKKGDIVFVSHGNRLLKAVGMIEGNYEHRPNATLPFTGYNHFRKVKWFFTDARIPVKDIYYANFSQQSIYALWQDRVKKAFFEGSKPVLRPSKNHVLIIDEINRGNVSAIFGELITLIEEDKRLGTINELRVTLPYSGEKFGVPNNLYLIGTMNTADRSVEALDTALRRRFSFKEMLPDPGLLKDENGNALVVEGINLQELLRTMNDRIEVLVDRDHTIGHAFFMNVTSPEGLREVFENKIIPLLQEYFYGNYNKIELIIGPAFFNQNRRKRHVEFAVQNTEVEVEDNHYELVSWKDTSIENFIDAVRSIMGKAAVALGQQPFLS